MCANKNAGHLFHGQKKFHQCHHRIDVVMNAIYLFLAISLYLRAAAPAADPGKEKPVMVSAGFVRVFCESSAWMLYIYIIYIYICIK